MRILVTGGAGFIGSAFVRLAAGRGLDVAVVDKLTYAGDPERLAVVSEKTRFHKVDIADEDALAQIFQKERPSAVVHFAAETHVDRSIISPREFILSNVTGTANLLHLSLAHGVSRFVHLSTDEVYGELLSASTGRFREEDPLLPNSPYSATKAGADMLARAFHRTYELPVITVRPSNNYGPWQYPEKLLPLTIAKALLGERIPVYGKGDNVRSWLFVEDCAKGVLALLEKGEPGQIYNIGSDEERPNLEVVRKVLSLLGKDESLVEFVPDRPGHDFRYAVDAAKIRAQTGWRPECHFERGLAHTVEWYTTHTEWLMRKKSEAEGFVALLRAHYASMKR
jgi:dTDP-glucose 4,6-dehydratase